VHHGAGTIIDGKYELVSALGQGGMGSVWTARHRLLDVPVAVKLMSPVLAASADARARFEREAKAAAQLKSPHVVDVRDYGVDGDTPYLVLELLQGEDLGARLKRRPRLAPAEAGVIVAQVCKALTRAHDAGIVHRDLKPANLFLARTDEGEVVKVVDFGIARARTPGLAGDATKTGNILGSPHYMSPEQARGVSDLDHRSDLWSLGVILFRALTGRLPFPGDQVGDIIVKVCSDPIPVASHLAPDLPPGTDSFFERALARDRDQRFASARELAEAFAELTTATVMLAGAAAPTERTMELHTGDVAGGAEKTAVLPSSALAVSTPTASSGTLTGAGRSIAEAAPRGPGRPGG
jgi:serine/threonine-protein kinase